MLKKLIFRIPVVEVEIPFSSIGDWSVHYYGPLVMKSDT